MTGRLPAHLVCPFVWSSPFLQESALDVPDATLLYPTHSTQQAPSDSVPLLVLSLNEDPFLSPLDDPDSLSRNNLQGAYGPPPVLLCPHLPGSGALPTYPSSANPTHRPSSEDKCALCLPHHPAGLGGGPRETLHPGWGVGAPAKDWQSHPCLPASPGASRPHRPPASQAPLPGHEHLRCSSIRRDMRQQRKPHGGACLQEEAHRPSLPSRSPSPTSLRGSQRTEFPLN